ncbi:lytic transglycosylase domain-containing protein [Shimazuella alba]|jgi:soluble lytic murein transglycosylase|uniref:Transglycosylase SLT domain-containing protein n=1 Tax=Shimazuella alba TaxID=2690964 RepID=A0A6I4VU76_9BACL|nr:lytic transglycosylase domain-containing protein [Shimazuella alba]MXQ54078.1 transglycosylase SLT domain-containing protein [Shimazuella alba]
MESSNLKKWIEPALQALPRKRFIFTGIILIILSLVIAFPLFNRMIYPLEYESNIIKSAKQTGTDPFLIMAIIRVETKFDPEKQSHVGAQGLMQLMPSTVDHVIKNGNFSPSMKQYIKVPAVNIQVGSWYISDLNRQFKGNKVAVIASYNAGPTRVKKWLSDGTWDGTRQNAHKIPYGETRHYVQRVTFFYEKYKSLYKDLVKE